MIIEKNTVLPLKTGKNRLMGIDYGEKNIGISISDTTWTIANPLQLLKRLTPVQNAPFFKQTIEDQNICAIIIGYPLNMNGTMGPSCENVDRFVVDLYRHIYVPFVLWDERLTTTAVSRTLIEADLSRKKRSVIIDRAAASYILQGFLDYMAWTR